MAARRKKKGRLAGRGAKIRPGNLAQEGEPMFTKQQLEEELARQKALNEKYEAQRQHNRDYHKRYAIEHPDKIKKAHAKYNAAHAGEALTPEQVEHQRAYHQQYNAAHKEQNRQYHKDYRARKAAEKEANAERIAELEAQLNQQ